MIVLHTVTFVVARFHCLISMTTLHSRTIIEVVIAKCYCLTYTWQLLWLWLLFALVV